MIGKSETALLHAEKELGIIPAHIKYQLNSGVTNVTDLFLILKTVQKKSVQVEFAQNDSQLSIICLQLCVLLHYRFLFLTSNNQFSSSLCME